VEVGRHRDYFRIPLCEKLLPHGACAWRRSPGGSCGCRGGRVFGSSGWRFRGC
jgi:hypothetical protein